MTSFLPLSSGWTFLEPKTKQWLEAKVPGCIHTDLLRHQLIPDPFWGSNELELSWIERADWIYRCDFDVESSLLAQDHIDLVAKGLDTVATITLNGKAVAATANMFVEYRFPVRELLKAGKNRLEIHFTSPMTYIEEHRKDHSDDGAKEWNDPVGGCSNIRKMQCSFGWDWGPRFPTSGIYREIGLESWQGNRIQWVHVRQTHTAGSVVLSMMPETCQHAPTAHFRSTLSHDGAVVTEDHGLTLEVRHPKLWWPNTLGDQPLYDLEVALLDDQGAVVDTWKRRIGLRTITLDRHPDEFGESFQFLVNGKPVFAKGANWIPAHSFITEVTHADYEDLIVSSVHANMNMIRVWGGGIYEMEVFYDLCDEHGLLVWQDFMFACALYPGTETFLKLVEEEAACQVKRLAHRASLALWCGNNEIEQMPQAILATPQRKAAYERVFYKILPDAVERYDSVTAYWPSSPHNPEGYEKGHNNESAGDCHFWDVWHARKPVKTYEQKRFRFCSEFGMQSYSSPEVAASFCPPEEFNVFSPAMENHQKNAAGNQIILDYISRLFRFPNNYASLAYLSQLNQAYCMKVGIEHFRRSMPRTMGALYWQLNDCWPVFSWSSIEYGGTWKALQWAAKRFFSPTLVSAHIPGEETVHIGNYVRSTIDEVHLYTVYDHPEPAAGTIGWALCLLSGEVLEKGEKAVQLRYGESRLQQTVSAKALMKKHGARNLYLRLHLDIGENRASEDTVFLTAPRFINFAKEAVTVDITQKGPGCFDLKFGSTVFQYQVAWHLRGIPYRADDNFFDLYPKEPRTIRVEVDPALDAAALAGVLETRSLVDSYA